MELMRGVAAYQNETRICSAHVRSARQIVVVRADADVSLTLTCTCHRPAYAVPMHAVTVRKEIVDRVLQRRGRYHLFDRLDPRRTALVVIDMQSAFCAPGGPAEGAGAGRRGG